MRIHTVDNLDDGKQNSTSGLHQTKTYQTKWRGGKKKSFSIKKESLLFIDLPVELHQLS